MEFWTDARRTLLHRILFGLLLTAAFAAYAVYRQRYIGACDWFGYFELGQLFRSGRVLLDTPLPVDQYPAGVPLGFIADGARAVPQYPPGYPLLLALAGWFGAESFVTPVIGVVSIAVVFAAAREFAGRWIALATAAMWAFFPIVVFGSTNYMSDLVAAVPLVGSYLLYRRGHLRSSALLLGISFWVRPTNVLYAVLFAGLLLRDRRLFRYVLWAVPTVAVYAAYNHFVYGAPWRTGYGNIAEDLTSSVFVQHLGFYLWQTAWHLGPLLPLVLLGLLRGRRSENVFLAAWFAAYVLFYSFWRSGGDVWWWTRFILPGYAPLFLLAAAGLQQVADWLRAWRDSAGVRTAAFAALALLVGLTIQFQVGLGLDHRDLWTRNKARAFYDITRTVEEFAPPGSLVGSVEFAGSFRVYGRSIPFFSAHGNAPKLVGDMLAQNRPVFLIVEPWNRTNPGITTLFDQFAADLVREIDLWGGVRIYRFTAAKS